MHSSSSSSLTTQQPILTKYSFADCFQQASLLELSENEASNMRCLSHTTKSNNVMNSSTNCATQMPVDSFTQPSAVATLADKNTLIKQPRKRRVLYDLTNVASDLSNRFLRSSSSGYIRYTLSALLLVTENFLPTNLWFQCRGNNQNCPKFWTTAGCLRTTDWTSVQEKEC